MTGPVDKIDEGTRLAGERTQLADARTSLAVTRTIVALDRTLMAWVRTATSLISFGFTIYKFFQSYETGAAPAPPRLLDARGFALVMMALGVGGLTVAIVEYRLQMKGIRHQYKTYGPFHQSAAPYVAAAISLLGIIGFVLAFFRQ